MHNGGSGLMVGKDECIGNDNVLFSPCRKYNRFSDVIWRQWITPSADGQTHANRKATGQQGRMYLRVDGICFAFVAVESND
jgi:hypothetical protein